MNNSNAGNPPKTPLLESGRINSPTLSRLRPITLVILLQLLVGILVFREFLFFDKLLLYTDIGADSLHDSYPYLVHLSDYVRRHGFPSWSFCVGMGQSLFYLTGNLIWEPVVWLPRELIAHALVFQHLLKTVIAGVLFFRFLQLRGLNLCASVCGSLLLSFSAYMCMGSCWIISADEIVCFTFLLFAVETALSYGRWFYVPFAVALIGLVTVFHLYLGAVLLCLYVPFRLVELYGWRPKVLSNLCAQLALFSFLGVGLAAIVCLGSAYSILHSPRGSGTIANYLWSSPPVSVFQLESTLYYLTAVLRPFSNNVIGIGDEFRGWQNYFDAPQSYCGLLCLLIFPQVFVGATRRQRILYSLFLALITIPVAFPWFRWLFWLFTGGYFRTFSLFSIFGILTLSMTALSRYTERQSLHLWTLITTLFVLVGVLYLPIGQMQILISPDTRRIAAILLILYAAVLIAGERAKRQSIVGWIIVGIAAVEVIEFDRMTVNRPTVTKQELTQRIGYNDATKDVVRNVKAADESFFRVTKTWSSTLATCPSFNDAMVFGYYGTSSYSSFNNLDYVRFLIAVDAIPRDDIARGAQWTEGLIRHPLLRTFTCEKYVVTRDPIPYHVADQYEFIRRYGDIYLFRNKEFLPLGLTFSRYLPEDIFLQLPSWAKPQALLHAVILSKKSAAKSELSQLPLDDLKQRMRDETSLSDVFAERRATALNIRSFRETRIDGTVRLDHEGILVFQMPFDAGWHSFVNGRPASVIKVDIGLLGVVLPAGEDMVQLIFRSPFLHAGTVVTLISCAIFSFSLWRWPRICGIPRE
jgi:hypothetical protein